MAYDTGLGNRLGAGWVLGLLVPCRCREHHNDCPYYTEALTICCETSIAGALVTVLPCQVFALCTPSGMGCTPRLHSAALTPLHCQNIGSGLFMTYSLHLECRSAEYWIAVMVATLIFVPIVAMPYYFIVSVSSRSLILIKTHVHETQVLVLVAYHPDPTRNRNLPSSVTCVHYDKPIASANSRKSRLSDFVEHRSSKMQWNPTRGNLSDLSCKSALMSTRGSTKPSWTHSRF